MTLKNLPRLFLLLASLLSIADLAVAQRLFQWTGQKFAPDADAGDQFGSSVAVAEDVLVVGARYDDELALNAGAVYVYRWIDGHWQPEQKLFVEGVAASAEFGASLAIDRDVIVAGAPGDDTSGSDVGSATVFRHNGTTWVREAKLTPPGGPTLTGFGSAVAVYEDAVLVGAPTFGVSLATGAAFVFRHAGGAWLQEQQLVASDAAADDGFGAAVALRREDILIGAPRNDEVGPGAGAAYLFQRQGSSWIQGTKLLGASSADQFGFSVALNGRVAAIGAPNYDSFGYPRGRVSVYRGGRFTNFEQFLEPPTAGGDFGTALAVDGDSLVASGASLVMFTYDGTEWIEQSRKVFSAPCTALALQGAHAIGAMPGDDAMGTNAGAIVNFVGFADGCVLAQPFARITSHDGTTLWTARGVSARPLMAAVGVEDRRVVILEKVAGTWTHTQTIVHAEPTDDFGAAVALGDGEMIIGAPGDIVQGTQAGAAIVYQWNGVAWEHRQTVRASDGGPNRLFGAALALEGDRLVIGAPADPYFSSDSAAYVFTRTGGQWVEEARLTVAGPNHFGSAVAVSGNVIVVGEDYDAGAGSTAGAAHVFRRVAGSWVLEQTLRGSDTNQEDRFGFAVAIAGETAVVSAPQTFHDLNRRGTVYTFRWNGVAWLEVSALHPVSDVEFWNFGYQLVLDPEGLAVGSGGAIYVFQHSTPATWRQVAHFVPSPLGTSLGGGVGWNGREVFAVEGRPPEGAIFVFRERLSLGVVPGAAKPGDRLEFVTCSGQPAAPLILAITEVDFSSVFFVITQGQFDVNGRFTLQLPVPPGVPNARVAFRAAGFSSDGTIRFSEPGNVYFE